MTLIDDQRVRELAAGFGVPPAVAGQLMAHTRPCVYLVPLDEVPPSLRDRTRPAARSGGLPALPEGTDWPAGKEPLILSIDCAALPRDALDIRIPPDGHLLVFSDIEYPPDSSAVLHVPAGTPTREHDGTYEIDGDPTQVTVYEPRTLYPVAGLTVDEDWRDGTPFDDAADGVLDRFEEAVLAAASGGTRPGVCVQLGGFSDPWDMPPDEGDLVLLAQVHGQAVDYEVFTLNLIVGSRQDIADGRYDLLQYEQQC
ncbi:DUF1963 domain-containing protein [Streptomyces sp. NPDC090106]|uniref:DUF1963 domain-containing protein n=1 Tax=Streptomyces sp. NPDC090106 TaxID=3365946 RepID=UPI00382C9A0A